MIREWFISSESRDEKLGRLPIITAAIHRAIHQWIDAILHFQILHSADISSPKKSLLVIIFLIVIIIRKRKRRRRRRRRRRSEQLLNRNESPSLDESFIENWSAAMTASVHSKYQSKRIDSLNRAGITLINLWQIAGRELGRYDDCTRPFKVPINAGLGNKYPTMFDWSWIRPDNHVAPYLDCVTRPIPAGFRSARPSNHSRRSIGQSIDQISASDRKKLL